MSRFGTVGAMLSELHLSGHKASEISSSIERSIRDGKLAPGDQLPTIRLLASHLGVSPTTVAAAYRQLRQRGIVTTYGRGGTRVHARPPIDVSRLHELPENVKDLVHAAPDEQLLPSRTQIASRLGKMHPSSEESQELEELLAKDLTSDGIPHGAVGLADSPQAALVGLLSTRHRPGDRIGVEDPCDPAVLDVLTAIGMIPVGLAMDRQGVAPSALKSALSKQLGTVVITPRGQSPTGAVFDELRALELGQILEEHPETAVFELDPNGPVAGAQYRTTISDREHSWAVVRSFGMALGHDLGFTALIGDAETISRVNGRQAVVGGGVSPVYQQILLEVLQDPDTHRTIALAARTYAARRITLLAELQNRGIGAVSESGVSIWIPVDNEAHTVETMEERGWAISAGIRCRIDAKPGVRIVCNRLLTDDARHFADDLLETLAE
ncbi:MAG: GntR family transcriptional regulator [Acidimicrobiales bacterium]